LPHSFNCDFIDLNILEESHRCLLQCNQIAGVMGNDIHGSLVASNSSPVLQADDSKWLYLEQDAAWITLGPLVCGVRPKINVCCRLSTSGFDCMLMILLTHARSKHGAIIRGAACHQSQQFLAYILDLIFSIAGLRELSVAIV
jgi:hypothetical protein